MKVVIIEDEILTAEDLKDILYKIDANIEVVATLQSVKEAVHYFKNNPLPQLIFSDIQLGDGLSFEIFSELDIRLPIIFCTAFDEYAIKAFNSSGIHYLLKPFNQQKISEAIAKYHDLKANFSSWSRSVEEVISELKDNNQKVAAKKTEAILVYYQNKVIPIKVQDIAVFYVKNETTHLLTFENKKYVVNKSLDELQQIDTELFYRANRQFIVNRHAVKEATHYQSRKLSVELSLPFEEIITISKEKVTQFFDWLANGSN